MDARGVGRRRVARVGAAAVRPQAAHIGLHGLRLGFGAGAGAAVGQRAGAAAAALAVGDVPAVAEVAVQVDAARVAVGAVVVVGVLAPREARFGALAAVGVGVQHQVQLVVVEHPGGVGVDAVPVDELARELQHQRRGGVLAGVDGAVDEELGLALPGRRRHRGVAELEHAEVVAAAAAGLLPGVAGIDPAGELRLGRRQRLGLRKALLDRLVAGVAGDAAGAGAGVLRRPLHALQARIALADEVLGHLEAEAEGTQPRLVDRVELEDLVAVVEARFEQLPVQADGGAARQRPAREPGLEEVAVGHLLLQQRGGLGVVGRGGAGGERRQGQGEEGRLHAWNASSGPAAAL